MKTDNSVACGFANSHIRIKRAKLWDMRYNWLRDRESQDQLRIYWDKGNNNDRADYFTKHFAPKHHVEMRPHFFVTNDIVKQMANTVTSLLSNVSKSARVC